MARRALAIAVWRVSQPEFTAWSIVMAEARGTPGRPFEILLVEDNYGDVVLTKEAFRRAQVPNTISVAGDGDEALRMLRREAPHANQTTPDVILLDLNLPRKHGREVIDEIGRDSAMRRIPIVIMTTSDVHAELVRRYPIEVKSYVEKPVNVESVQRIIALIGAAAGNAGDQHESFERRVTDAERELSEFTYVVSHDLAAPLRHVAAFSTLLIRGLGPDASSEHLAYCDHIQRATQKCQAMLNEVLAFSRAQQALMTPEACDATLLMEVAMLQLSAEVQSAGADISVEPLGTLVADPALMTQVFRHVLGNAIKFRRSDAAVKISVRAVQASNAWTVQIADNGPGVALERQDKLFRLFYQDEPEGTFEGVGAGLAIARRILRRHGGDAHFVAAEQGACLEITLPVEFQTETMGAE